jgi:hypothetical protein
MGFASPQPILGLRAMTRRSPCRLVLDAVST